MAKANCERSQFPPSRDGQRDRPVKSRAVPGDGSYDLHSPADSSLAVDHLSAFFGAHTGTKANCSRPFDLAGLVRIVHVVLLSFLNRDCHRLERLIPIDIARTQHNLMRAGL
jgi:hypothetical protein